MASVHSKIEMLVYALLLTAATSISALALPAKQLAQEVGKNIHRVAEFKFLAEEAARLGLKSHLAGDSAAGFANYVQQSIEFKSPSRSFNFHYADIFDTSQTPTFYIEGKKENIALLREKMKERYPRFFEGEKAGTIFLDSPNPASWGGAYLEISETPGPSRLLEDISRKQIQFQVHERKNAPREMIETLIAANRYGLEIEADGLAEMKSITEAFNPKELGEWLEKNAQRLLSESRDLEKSMALLDKIGLRQKLSRIGSSDSPGSVAWWMNKAPLPSSPVGMGKGRTAKAVAKAMGLPKLRALHETDGYSTYESLTRPGDGTLNALISRDYVGGEVARHGAGFYATVGEQGSGRTRISVEMEILDTAREGADFTVTSDEVGAAIIVKNRSAVRVLPEKPITLLEYFRQLARGEGDEKYSFVGQEQKTIARDQPSAISTASVSDFKEIEAIIKKEALSGESDLAINYYLGLPQANERIEMLNFLATSGDTEAQTRVALKMAKPGMEKHPDILKDLIQNGDKIVSQSIGQKILPLKQWISQAGLVEEFIRTADLTALKLFHAAIKGTRKKPPFWAELERRIAAGGGSFGSCPTQYRALSPYLR